jgi:Zn-dependent protease with chaperone function
MDTSDNSPPATRSADESASPPRTEWRGDYIDSHKGRRRPAEIRLTADGIEIRPASGEPILWPYGEIRQTKGFHAGYSVHLQRGVDVPETLVVRDLAFIASLPQIGRDLGRCAPEVSRRRGWGLRATVGMGLALAVIGAAAYTWGIPLLADVAASRVPVTWEDGLGTTMAERIATPGRQCRDAEQQRQIAAIVARLAQALPPESPYRYRVLVVDGASVDVRGLPGGIVVLSRRLLERTESPEELAGVLAHEIHHVRGRDATREVLRNASPGLLFAALTGDVARAGTYGAEGVRTLHAHPYGPRAEDEADRATVKILVGAGIDPAGIIALLERLESPSGAGKTWVQDHVSEEGPNARARKLRRAAEERAQVAPIVVRPFSTHDWRAIRQAC